MGKVKLTSDSTAAVSPAATKTCSNSRSLLRLSVRAYHKIRAEKNSIRQTTLYFASTPSRSGE